MVKRNVVWTGTAVKQRTEILRYWTVRNGSPKYAKKLLKLIDDKIKVIRKFPEAFKSTIYPETRISAMGHFSILYKIIETQIIVTSFWDNRQDPEKLLEIIRACLNFIGEIYYAAIFERNKADFFCIAGATEKKSNEAAAKNRHKKLGE